MGVYAMAVVKIKFVLLLIGAILLFADHIPVAAASIIAGSARSKQSSSNTRSPVKIDSRTGPSEFKAYWNIPSFQCKSHNIYFTDVYKNYGITQNAEDTFRGDKFAILYDPGNFPALIEEGGRGNYVFRNGGLPQEGDLELHLKQFRESVEQQIPDENFSGVAVIDFESWRPVFRQNFGSLQPYKDESYEAERKRHPLWPTNWIKKEAEKRFEQSGRKFVEQTMLLAKHLRPAARWGYYAFPYCFNMNPKTKNRECSDQVVQENNDIQWMWDASDLLLPSVYFSSQNFNSQERQYMVSGRTNEAKRIQKKTSGDKSIMLYFWYKYQDDSDKFLTKEDVYNSMEYMYKEGLEGVILWGSSNDVNSKDKCLKLREYVETVLGPAIKEFTQNTRSKSLVDDGEAIDTTEAIMNGNIPNTNELQDLRSLGSAGNSSDAVVEKTKTINNGTSYEVKINSVHIGDDIKINKSALVNNSDLTEQNEGKNDRNYENIDQLVDTTTTKSESVMEIQKDKERMNGNETSEHSVDIDAERKLESKVNKSYTTLPNDENGRTVDHNLTSHKHTEGSLNNKTIDVDSDEVANDENSEHYTKHYEAILVQGRFFGYRGPLPKFLLR